MAKIVSKACKSAEGANVCLVRFGVVCGTVGELPPSNLPMVPDVRRYLDQISPIMFRDLEANGEILIN